MHRRKECLPLGGISALLINAANCIIRNVKHIANVNFMTVIMLSPHFGSKALKVNLKFCFNLVNIFPDWFKFGSFKLMNIIKRLNRCMCITQIFFNMCNFVQDFIHYLLTTTHSTLTVVTLIYYSCWIFLFKIDKCMVILSLNDEKLQYFISITRELMN
jgi:hypothetical protein